MAAVVHMGKPTTAVTFKDYLPKHLLPFMESQLTPTCERVDAVYDVYIGNISLKTQCRARRGETTNQQTRVDSEKTIPKGAA